MTTVWKAPSVTVAAVIEREGRFLLVEEDYDGKRVFNQPAGHLDPGESLVSACAREVLEETAHRFLPESLVGIYRWYYAPRDVTFIRFTFAGRLHEREAGRVLDEPIVATHWFTRADLVANTAHHRTPLVMSCVDDYLRGKRFSLDVFARDYA